MAAIPLWTKLAWRWRRTGTLATSRAAAARVAGWPSALSDLRLVRRAELGSGYADAQLGRLLDHLGVDCVFDVGAHTGQYVELLRDRIGYEGLVLSFEPLPALAKELRAKAERDPHWIVIERALDASVRDATFHAMRDTQFSSLLEPDSAITRVCADANVVADRIDVRTHTLRDEYLRLRAIHGFVRPFLKLDTQGSDLAIAMGAGTELASFVGLQTELAMQPLYRGAPDWREHLAFLEAAGFALCALVPNNGGHFPDLVEFDGLLMRADAPNSR